MIVDLKLTRHSIMRYEMCRIKYQIHKITYLLVAYDSDGQFGKAVVDRPSILLIK